MERFTYKHGKEWCISGVNGNLTSDRGGNYWGVAVDRLAHYEDLEEQGRLVVLKAAVGDSFFKIERFCDEHGELEEVERHWGSDCEFCSLLCNAELRIVEYSFANIRHIIDMECAIGKTVFLTRAEAEVALSECKKQADNKFNYCPNCGARMEGAE